MANFTDGFKEKDIWRKYRNNIFGIKKLFNLDRGVRRRIRK